MEVVNEVENSVERVEKPNAVDLRIPFNMVQTQAFKFAVNIPVKQFDEKFMLLQTPEVSGLIPFFKIERIDLIEETVKVFDGNQNNLVKGQYYKIIVETTYAVLDDGFKEYKEWLKRHFSLDLNPYMKAFVFEERPYGN